jgi:hypothetical protein
MCAVHMTRYGSIHHRPGVLDRWRTLALHRCGTRTVVAIKLDQKDPRNYNGPPYSIAEHVMDEYDLVTCYPTKALRDEQYEDVNDGPV